MAYEDLFSDIWSGIECTLYVKIILKGYGEAIDHFQVSNSERKRFLSEKRFPISTVSGNKIWCKENGMLHRIDGPAFINYDDKRYYYLNGIASNTIRLYFFAQKIKLLQKLLHIPEAYDKVYYDQKRHFISLRKKI